MHCQFAAPGSPRGWNFSVYLCSAGRVSYLLSDCVFPYTEDYSRSQHLVVSPTVFSTHCPCVTNVHVIPASGDYEIYHMPLSRAGMRQGGLVCSLLFEHGVGRYQIELSANRSSPLELHFLILYLSKATCHFLFLSLH